MATLAAFPKMLEHDRRRNGLRVCRTAWLLGVSIREYRKIEAGEHAPDGRAMEGMFEVFGWPLSRLPRTALTGNDVADARQRTARAV